jgi:methylglutaconyl-CoA hydratase
VREIKSVFAAAEKDASCKVIVLRANGEAFCAGADLAYLQQLQTNSHEENLADSNNLMELFRMIYLFKKVVIAQINGPALAGGCGLATVCDFCFATAASTFGYTEVKIGFVPAIVMVFLIRKVGEKTAREILLSGNVFNALQAKNYQLINDVYEANELESKVDSFASALVKTASAESLGMVKQMLARVQNLSLDEGLSYAAEMNAQARKSTDCKKGIAAFLNKEKLSW